MYTLRDPIDNEIKYVGRTKNNLKIRLYGHLYKENKNSKKKSWIYALSLKNLRPIIEEIETIFYNCDSQENWEKSHLIEKFWIEQFLQWNFKLLNHIDNGAGFIGRVWSDSQYDIMNVPIHQYTLKGFYINSFKSITEASKITKIPYKSIQGASKDESRKSGYGYLWSREKKEKIDPFKRENFKPIYQYSCNGELLNILTNDFYFKENGFKLKSVKSVCVGESKTMYGYVWSFGEFKNPIRKEIVGKKIYQYDLDRKLIKEWINVKLIHKSLNFSINKIRQVLCGSKKTYKNFIWSYKLY